MSENGQRRGAAFFDLDRTVIDVNSGFLYARHEYRSGRIRTLTMVQSVIWTGLYHLAVVDMERTFRKALGLYRGESEAILVERTGTWFAAEVLHRRQPGAEHAMGRHRAAGEPLVLLTNSSPYMADVAARAWGFDAWLANRFHTDENGCLTGEFEAPLCYGLGKVHRAEQWAREAGVDLQASTFYTDSYTDLPMLQRVGRPRVVNPDPRLRRAAKRAGWPILDWRQVEGAVTAP